MQSKSSRCVYQLVAAESWEMLWLHRGALDLCAGRCDQNVIENEATLPHGFLLHHAEAGLHYRAMHQMEAGSEEHTAFQETLTTNMQICKCTPSFHSI